MRNRAPSTLIVLSGWATVRPTRKPARPLRLMADRALGLRDRPALRSAHRWMSRLKREVQVCVLSSGSAGNCTYVGDGHAGVLIDCGLSTKQIMTRLEEMGLGAAPIDAVLVTHEHGDHIAAAAVLWRALAARGRPVPFYMTRGTAGGLPLHVQPDGIEFVRPGDTVAVSHLRAECFPIPHDTAEPIAWRVHLGEETVGVVTDLGCPTAIVAEKLSGCDLAVLEFNHDEEMLRTGSYPESLKQRIKGDRGHLSNSQAATLLGQGLSPRLKTLVLAHLSEANNSPTKALESALGVLHNRGVSDEIRVHIGRQREALAPLRVGAFSGAKASRS